MQIAQRAAFAGDTFHADPEQVVMTFQPGALDGEPISPGESLARFVKRYAVRVVTMAALGDTLVAVIEEEPDR